MVCFPSLFGICVWVNQIWVHFIVDRKGVSCSWRPINECATLPKTSCNSMVMSKGFRDGKRRYAHRSFCPIFWKLTKCWLLTRVNRYCLAELKESRRAGWGSCGCAGGLQLPACNYSLLYAALPPPCHICVPIRWMSCLYKWDACLWRTVGFKSWVWIIHVLICLGLLPDPGSVYLWS